METKYTWALCPNCRTYFPPREIGYMCPNCEEAELEANETSFTVFQHLSKVHFPAKSISEDFVTLRQALDLDPQWPSLRREIASVWADHVQKKCWYRGNVDRKILYLRAQGRRYLSGRVNFSLLKNFSNSALKLLVGIVWARKIHPFGRYSCKCWREGLQPERAEHRCRRSHKDCGLCGTCLLPVDPRGCWLCRSCGGVLVWKTADWNLLIPKAARENALNTGV